MEYICTIPIEVECTKQFGRKETVPVRLSDDNGITRAESLGCDSSDGGVLCKKCIDAAIHCVDKRLGSLG